MRVSGSGATPEATADLEVLVGRSLPDDYRRFLVDARGGQPPGEIAVFRGEDGEPHETTADIHGLPAEGACVLVDEVREPRWGPLAEG